MADTIEFLQVNAPTEISIQAAQVGRLLIFKNAILARVEKNKNSDELSEQNISELAETLPGMAIDLEHNIRANLGVYTAARAVSGNAGAALSVDGFIWADRYPEVAEGIQNGTYHQSIEANAEKAVCSICGGEFSKSDSYCKHLINRKTSGASRKMVGLTAEGGGVVKNPAGTDTKFDPTQIRFVANHEENDETPKIHIKAEAPPMKTNCPHCGVENTAEAPTCSACKKSMSAAVIAAELRELNTRFLASQAEAEVEKASRQQAEESLSVERNRVTAAETDAAKAKAELRKLRLAPFMEDDEWESGQVRILAMTDDAFDLMASTLDAKVKAPEGSGGLRLPTPKETAGSAKEPITLQ